MNVRVMLVSALMVLAAGLIYWQSTMLQAQEEHAAHGQQAAAHPLEAIKYGVAVIEPTQDNKVSGVVRFIEQNGSVRVVAEVSGLQPNSKHGFHVHQFGDATAADATSAGSHYSPEGHPHGGPDADVRHAGDLGNLEADAQGVAHYDRTFKNITIAGHNNPVIGRAVIVHAKADDLQSQPTGDAGGRIGYGIVGVGNPATLSKAE